MKEVYDKLILNKDDTYKEFQAKLVPNIPKESIIGVRTPELRELAKEIYNSDYKEAFLNEIPHKYYEENILHMFVISLYKDFDECINELDKFLPYVDCWPVSDQASPKIFKKNHDKLIKIVKRWIKTPHIYTIRFAIRMLMNEYLDKDFDPKYLSIVANIKGDDYYLKMMIAWYFATALAKKYDETIPYFENHLLDDWVHKKAISKAIESFRVTSEHKEYLKTLR